MSAERTRPLSAGWRRSTSLFMIVRPVYGMPQPQPASAAELPVVHRCMVALLDK
jgi:hypothetical protein